MRMDVDEVLEKIGPNGKFQIRTVLIAGWILFCRSMFVLVPTFLAGDPGWTCKKNSTTCNMTGTYRLGMEQFQKRCSLNRSAWEYNKDFTSVTTEWDLVCDRALLSSVTSSLYFAGYLIGVIGFGYLSDKFGRRKIACICSVAVSVISFSSAFSPNVEFFNFCRFGIGAFGGGVGLVLFLICMEVTGVKHRGTFGTALWVSFVFGVMAISPLAYLLRDWRDLSLALGIFCLTIIPACWWLPETPRWLVVNGQMKEAQELFQKIADINGIEYHHEEVKVLVQQKTRRANLLDLFKSKKYTKNTLIQWYAWMVNALVYYCVSLGTSNIGGDMYLTYFLLALVELPATFATMWCVIKFGRKMSVVGCLWLAGLASIFAALFPMHHSVGFTVGRVTMALIAKFMVTISFDGIYVWTGELFPTSIRNIAMGSCSSAARIGSFSSSFVNYLLTIHELLPFAVMAVLCASAGGLCIFLPETRGRPTIEDFEPDDPTELTLKEMPRNELRDVNDNPLATTKEDLASLYLKSMFN